MNDDDSLPLAMDWVRAPKAWSLAEGVLSVTAAPHSDDFTDPVGGAVRRGAAVALTDPPEGDWQLSARLRVGFGSAWDAGGILVWSDDDHWAKLTFELSHDGLPSVYSVVTRGRSDDALGGPVAADALWLRISRLGEGYVFHVSDDGVSWRLVRQFALDGAGPARVGIVAQSPVGEGCRADFDEFRLAPTTLAHLFDGR
ncbi:DUF1349 domain-containing protein [Streptomyces sp. CB02261]|uniref:DUF1349 domain-containing protein n=1 Tax=Streptomyces sp. CB02261 TaxID=1703940 RepID=UPI00093C116E|nr:DUF1349 domain-containing protein [Streptomyces sp. CB02261]OKJ66091.1 hypothetical protein AMK29_15370 [Streptomyces sp. CB02261]